MAINTETQYGITSFTLEGIGQKFSIISPLFFRDLLAQTLTGWHVSSIAKSGSADIQVGWENDQFFIESNLVKSVPKRVDLIDVLNEFFLSLAYLTTAKTEGAQLIHCAAFNVHGRQSIIFGKKNSGKSSLTFEKARVGAEILADDMLVWLPRSATFTCIGLPLRMRRPVIGLEGTEEEKKWFIAGKQIAYAQKDAFRIASAGYSFVPDKIYRLENRSLSPVPFLSWPKAITEHSISSEYTSLRIV